MRAMFIPWSKYLPDGPDSMLARKVSARIPLFISTIHFGRTSFKNSKLASTFKSMKIGIVKRVAAWRNP